MKVDAGGGYPFANQRNPASAPAGTADFASILSSHMPDTRDAASSTTEGDGPDFTSMTRQELFDWMNDRIRGGDMSLDESSAFLGMTMRISVTTGQPADMATEKTRYDFTEKARLGIKFSLAHFDHAAAGRLQAALDRMLGAREGAF